MYDWGGREEGKEEYNCPVACIALVWDVWVPLLLSLISVVVCFGSLEWLWVGG